jgi:hypothetical protein
MSVLSIALLLLTASSAIASAATESTCFSKDHPDFVPRLPGFNQPLPSAWFSGYLTYELEGRTIHTHYVLVQAEEDFDEGKPLIYWSNGGPGASSLLFAAMLSRSSASLIQCPR